VAWPWAALLLKVEVVSYVLLLVFLGFQKAMQHKQASLVAGIPLAIMTMHLSWGAAFLFSLLRPGEGKAAPTNG
jgi:hypothetical protein